LDQLFWSYRDLYGKLSSQRRLSQVVKARSRDDLKLLAILGLIYFNPYVIARQIKHEFGISRSTTYRILQFAQYHPYYFNLVQKLSEGNCRLRIQFCRWHSMHWSRIQISFGISVLVTKLHFMAISIGTIVITDH